MQQSGTSSRIGRSMVGVGLLGLAAVLSVATSKPRKQTPPPGPPPGAGSGQPGQGDPNARQVRRPRRVRAPRLRRLSGYLPGGVFHGYMWWTKGSDRCKSILPSFPLKKCAIRRGVPIGCGSRVVHKKKLPFCLRGVHRMCRLNADGIVFGCSERFSGWSLTQHKGLIRRCCIRNGKLHKCTNDRAFICTDADRQRIAEAKRLARLRRLRARRARRTRSYSSSSSRSRSRRGSYKKCRIFNGRVSSCFGWYHGNAVVYYRGSYQMCRIFNGQVSSCRGWYKGKAPAYYQGAWKKCTIFNGRISSCFGWYRGQAAVWRTH